MRYRRVGVLEGGVSGERAVSLMSGQAVAAGLERSGYDVVEIDFQLDLDRRLREANVEAVFIALHGRWGEDGTVQGMLEMMALPYTGSSVLASALAMDKVLARIVFEANGLPVPRGFAPPPGEPVSLPHDWSLPVVVKPVCEGSSLGISIVHEESRFQEAVKTARKCSDEILIEAFVDGMEVTVAVLDGEVLGALEMEPHNEFYDYSAKYYEGGSTHHIPPRIEASRLDEALHMGKRAFDAIKCSGAVRADLIVPKEGPTVVLEVNTVPGMTDLSLLPEIAAAYGLSFDQFVSRIMEGATLHTK